MLRDFPISGLLNNHKPATDSKPNGRFIVVTCIVLIAALARLIPHPPNVTPLAAMALFGGAYFGNRYLALMIPFVAMLLSDLVIGFHPAMPFIYASLAFTVLLGMALKRRRSAPFVIGASLLASTIFFVVSNFGFWLTMGSGMYPMTSGGLVSCYLAGIPFYRDALLGDLFFASCLFGGFELATRIALLLRRPALARLAR